MGRIFLILTCLYAATISAATATYTHTQLANLLGWVPTHYPCNVCDGHYQQPPLVYEYPHPQAAGTLPTTITAQGPSIFSRQGYTLLQQNVVLTQAGRVVNADKAYIFRDRKTGKITLIHLIGHVKMQEYGKVVIAKEAIFDFKHKTVKFIQAGYHLAENNLTNGTTEKAPYEAYGQAKLARRVSKGILYLWHATYSTCAPINPTWELQASYMRLNKITGVGVAHNVIIKLKHLPIFYSPYFSFPLDNRRRTGFLGITGGFSSLNGTEFRLPFYWNIAPNYDATIEPHFMSKRGLQLNTTFRYLTTKNAGSIYVSYIPADRQFSRYINNTLAQFANTNDPTLQPYLHDLRKMSANRGYFSYENTTTFSPQWSAQLITNYVTDPYYFRDFGVPLLESGNNQLLNQFAINYESRHWQSNIMAQAYQTLHAIDQIDNPATNQYVRLPEWNTQAFYPDMFHGVDFILRSQIVNFIYRSDYPLFTFQRPIGQRLNIRPIFRRPFDFASGYFTPQIALDSTSYNSDLATNTASITRPHFTKTRNVPLFSIDWGLFFSRWLHIHHHTYKQTLEPRVFYLYVPYQNQDAYPDFDTQLLPFTFDQLFALNRFAGVDRIENANQVSFSLTTRFIDSETDLEKLNAGLGFIYYFATPRVGIPNITTPITLPAPNIFPDSGQISPVVGEVTYYPWQHWSVTGSAAWNFQHEAVDNANVSLNFTQSRNKIISLGYQFVRYLGGISIDTLGLSNDTNYVHLGFAWPLSQRWSLLSSWYYNLARQRPDGYYAGLQYSTCCWAIRLVANRNFTGVDPGSTMGHVLNQYANTYYIQFLLKGLGGLGNNDPGTLLATSLPGYQDLFTTQ